jgi:hypothetical protein
MRYVIHSTDSVLLCDTTNVPDGMDVLLQAMQATPVWIATERAPLDFTDQTGTPTGGFFLNSSMPPLLLIGYRGQLWGRAGQQTSLEVQVFRASLGSVPLNRRGTPTATGRR